MDAISLVASARQAQHTNIVQGEMTTPKMTIKLIYFALIVFFTTAIWKEDGDGSYAAAQHSPSTSRPLSVLLVTAPFAGHLLPCLALGEALVKREHNVTLVSAPTDFVKREINKRDISLWSIGEGFISDNEHRKLVQHTAGKSNEYSNTYNLLHVLIDFEKRLKETIDNAEIKSFDIILGDKDHFVSLMCYSSKWKLPVVYLSTMLMFETLYIQSWPIPFQNSGHTENLTFLERLVTYTRQKASFLMFKILCEVYSSMSTGVCKKQNISVCELLMFPDYHPTIITSSIGFEFSRTLLPLTHYVGPMISQYQPQLPQHIEEWLSGRDPKSVVYVSMGTIAILTSAQAEMIVNGATRANLSVVWSLRKTNQHILEHMTFDCDSVLIADWLTQVTILRHPSIHSAVLHGGLGGIQEALSSGVPIVVIPFLFDQLDNGVRVKYYNYGEMIKLHELSTPLVTHTLQVIGTELYRKSLKKIQRIYKKDGGASRAADLIEFYSDVGYEHLIPSYAKYNWSWIECYAVDTSLVVTVVLLLLSYPFYRPLVLPFIRIVRAIILYP